VEDPDDTLIVQCVHPRFAAVAEKLFGADLERGQNAAKSLIGGEVGHDRV